MRTKKHIWCVRCYTNPVLPGQRNRPDSDTSPDHHRRIQPGDPAVCMGCRARLNERKLADGLPGRIHALRAHYVERGWELPTWLISGISATQTKQKVAQMVSRRKRHLHVVPRRKAA